MDFTIPFPNNEIERLKSLLSYEILDTLPEVELDSLTELASYICNTPISLITLIDKERQWFKSKRGFESDEIDRNISFCQKTILQDNIYEVPDLMSEPLFENNPFITGEGDIKFYAGYPLKSDEGFNIGTICVLDRVPRNLNQEQKKALEILAHSVVAIFELRKKNNLLQKEVNELVEDKIDQKDIDLKAYKFALDETSIVFITDPEGVIVDVNDKQCEISKYKRTELIGQHSRILNSGYHSKDFIKNMWTTIQSGATWKGEFKNQSKDGKLYWVDTTIIPLRDKYNETYQYLAIRQDITDRKIREDKLIVYEDIVKNMSAGVYVFMLDNTVGPPDFTITASNLSAFKFTGINGTKVIGKKMSEIFPDLMHTDIPRKFKKIALGSDPMFIGEFQYNSESFKEEYFELSAFSLPNNSLGVSFDNITERKLVETELMKAKGIAEQSVIAKDNFLANMSHEIRTPMNAIIGFTDILINTQLDSSQRESVSAVKSAGENLLEIINDILDFSKIESGKLKIENRPFNIRETLKKVIDLLKIKAEEKNIQLSYFLESNLPETVSGDKTRLNQIIVNLVGNAIKFTNAGAVVVDVKCFEGHNENCTVSFSVKDSGIGIPEDKLSHIFERFTQASNSTTRKFGGTGLGLSIVKNLIELQGGSIEVQSAIGSGSEFVFKINYPIVKEKRLDQMLIPEENKDEFKTIKVLLFEDNPLNQKLAKMVLKGFGFESDIAENGKIGVEMLAINSYDIILMDLQMPEMDGYQATDYIRNQLKLTIPIMAMTAHSLLGEKEKCLGMGMNDYITKPFKQDELLTKIRDLVIKNNPEIKIANEGLINLEYLKELCEGDIVFEKELIDLFKIQVPGDFELLVDGVNKKDFNRIQNLSHKLRSSVTIVGLKSTSELFAKIEANARNEQEITSIQSDMESLSLQLNQAYEELEILSYDNHSS